MKKERIELEKKMTDKEINFCREYILDWNGARAARVAGYSGATARSIASKLLTKANVQAYIALIKEQIAEEVGISKTGLLKKLKNIAEVNVGHVYKDWITLEQFDEIKDMYPEVMDAIQEISTKVEQEKRDGEVIDVKYVKIKLYDKRLAIQDIFKAMGWNAPEKVEHSGTMQIEGIEYVRPEDDDED